MLPCHSEEQRERAEGVNPHVVLRVAVPPQFDEEAALGEMPRGAGQPEGVTHVEKEAEDAEGAPTVVFVCQLQSADAGIRGTDADSDDKIFVKFGVHFLRRK